MSILDRLSAEDLQKIEVVHTKAVAPIPDKLKWSGKRDVPAIGADVVVRMNNLGSATVTGYIVQSGWLGVFVKLHNPPQWYLNQNALAPDKPETWPDVIFFGAELA